MNLQFTLLSFLSFQMFTFAQVNCNDIHAEFSGYCYDYHANDTISDIKEFKNGKAVGIWMQFDSKGKLIKQLNTASKQDSLGKIYPISKIKHWDMIAPDLDPIIANGNKPAKDSINWEYDIFELVEEEASFEGGNESLVKWLNTNLIYPQYAKEAGFEGKVYVKFVVERDGTILAPIVMKGIKDCNDCDKEAKRLVKSMPKWTPAKHQGRIVRSYRIIVVKFSLD